MATHNFKSLLVCGLLLVGCGTGNNNVDFGSGGSDGSSGSSGGSSSGAVSGTQYHTQASVVQDGCGERISPVTQTFAIDGGNVDTSILNLQTTAEGSGFSAAFQETNGNCTRDYKATFSNMSGSGGNIDLSSISNCGGSVCENKWSGTLTTGSARSIENRVTGTDCVTPVPEVGYRPSLFECNGNAAVLLRGSFRNAYSVVVRVVGQYNDRDPKNTGCGTNRCSPYKVQKKIELPEYEVNCLGASGYSDYFRAVTRISIKFSAEVKNSHDESQFNQYCLNDKQSNLN